VGLDSVIIAFQQGATPEQIADDFPVLSLDDIKAIISYYLHNRVIVDDYLAELAKIGERNRIRWESDPQTTGSPSEATRTNTEPHGLNLAMSI
jgi:hypothetical protein